MSDREWVLNAPELGELLGVSRKTVYEWVKRGMPQLGRGRFDARLCTQWLLADIRGENPERDPQDIQEARRLLYVAQTDKVRLDIATAERELIPGPEVAHALTGLATLLAGQLDALAPRCALEVAGEHDPAAVQRIIFAECRAIRQAMAGQLAGLGLTADGLLDTDAATRTRRRPVGRRKKTASGG